MKIQETRSFPAAMICFITRRVFPIATVFMLAHAASHVAAAAPGADAAPHKPDVLVILTDQWSPRFVSWDNPQVRTPNLDRIAGEGMIFDACYTTSPVCMPARVSLITGLFPHNGGHGLWGNATAYYPAPESAPMFRDIQAAGYTTAQIGKTHWVSGTEWKQEFKNIDEYFHALGLDEVADIAGPVDSPKEHNPYAQHLRQIGLLDAVAADLKKRYLEWEFEPRASLVKPEDYHDSFVTTLATDYIRKQPKDKPMCLVVSLHSPHPPLDPPGEFATMYDPGQLTLPGNVPDKYLREGRVLDHAETKKILASYLGKISLADHCIGRLIDAMKARGTWDEAFVAFTADHGEMMGSHGALTKGRFYEESARVPLVMRWPGHVQKGRTQALAQMMDVYPTAVEVAQGTLSSGRFAKSLLPVATGQKKSVRPLAVSEIGNAAPLRIMARGPRYKYWAEESKEFLFDIENDPLEMHDLASVPEHAATLNRMREELLVFLRSSQVNYAEGYKNKVQRMREAEGAAKKKKEKEKP
jgi:arylsulfatase A-like enzyme